MKITKHGFKSPLPDNDQFYINFVTDALKHSDPEAEILLNKFEQDIKVSVTPSEPSFRQHIIDNLLAAHRLFHIKIIFSKSLAKEKRVNYLVEL